MARSTTSQASSKGASSMAELMRSAGSSVKPIQKGDIVEGILKKLTSKEILMDIGAKGDALVIEFDKRNLENLLALLKVGDRVKASVISAESEEGFPVVSLRRTLDDLIFSRFDEFNKKNEAFPVLITEATRGGYFAEASFGIRGFLPNSQVIIDLLSEKDLVGKHIDVKIIEFDRAKKRVIFSQKATKYLTDPSKIEAYLKKGDVLKAVVNSVTPYGIYVTLTPKGSLIEGFIHISEVSHERVENLGTLFTAGEEVEVQILEIDRENRRVNLSLKSLLKDKFEDAKTQYKKEQKVKGVVKDVRTRGITLTLAEGISGFIPGAKIPTDTTYTVGQELELEVDEIDEKRRVILVSPILKKTFVGYR